jgi:hypothetical protein
MVNESTAEDLVYVSCSVYNAYLVLGLAIHSVGHQRKYVCTMHICARMYKDVLVSQLPIILSGF